MATIRHESVLALLSMEEVISALPYPIIVVNGENTIVYLNGAGENFFEQSRERIAEQSLFKLFPVDSPIHTLLSKVRSDGVSISECDIDFIFQNGDGKSLSISVAPLNDNSGLAVICIHPQEVARNLERQHIHRNAARSVTAMASMLAQKVRTPLCGIKGAAQLLEHGENARDKELAHLICGEVDRICALVDNMDKFGSGAVFEHRPVNIHEDNENLARSVERHLKKYFDAHLGELPAPGLYDRILREVERPLISLTLSMTSGNQVRAAKVLGLNRNTLRKKIRQLNIDIVRSSQ